MEVIIIIIQMIKDLIGSLNPLRLFSRDYRQKIKATWQSEGLIFKIGYVLGVAVILIIFILIIIYAADIVGIFELSKLL